MEYTKAILEGIRNEAQTMLNRLDHDDISLDSLQFICDMADDGLQRIKENGVING